MRAPRRRGAKPHPRGRITASSRRLIDASGATRRQLAMLSGFTAPNTLSTILNDDFALARITVARLTRLADLIGVRPGDLFEEVPR